MTLHSEDTHFYIDSAPPSEVTYVLRVLTANMPINAEEIRDTLQDLYGFTMQGDVAYSPRRLYDLKLIERERQGSAYRYSLTDLGSKLQTLLATDEALVYELLHYLHFTSFTGALEDRKLFWSYRKCCEYIWSSRQLLPSKELAARIQADIVQDFPSLPTTEKQGGRFNATGANQGIAWLRALSPTPVAEDNSLKPRIISNFHLSVLGLDDFYRHEGLAYGSSIVLTDGVLDKIAQVFFLDATCCRELLKTAAYLTTAFNLTDTLVGTSVTLNRPYTLGDL